MEGKIIDWRPRSHSIDVEPPKPSHAQRLLRACAILFVAGVLMPPQLLLFHWWASVWWHDTDAPAALTILWATIQIVGGLIRCVVYLVEGI